MVTVVENGYGGPSSNLGRGCLHFTLHKAPWEGYEWNHSQQLGVNSRAD